MELFCGDCLEKLDNIANESIDLILADPPYCITACKWDTEIIPLDKMWQQLHRVVKPNGAIILFGSGMFTAECMRSNAKSWRYNLIYEKTTPTGFLNANRMPMRAHEDIMVFYKKPPTYNPQKTTGNIRKISTAKQKENCKNGEVYREYEPYTYLQIFQNQTL